MKSSVVVATEDPGIISLLGQIFGETRLQSLYHQIKIALYTQGADPRSRLFYPRFRIGKQLEFGIDQHHPQNPAAFADHHFFRG